MAQEDEKEPVTDGRPLPDDPPPEPDDDQDTDARWKHEINAVYSCFAQELYTFQQGVAPIGPHKTRR